MGNRYRVHAEGKACTHSQIKETFLTAKLEKNRENKLSYFSDCYVESHFKVCCDH